MSQTKKTIEEQLDELRTQIEWFDSDDFTLEAALDRFAVAEKTAHTIEQELGELKNTITVVKQRFDEAGV